MYFAYGFLTPESTPWATDKQGKPLAKNPMRDVRVREALSLAIDRKAIAQRVMDGAAEPINQFATLGMRSWNKDLPELAYDPARAKKLLADAGYADGFGLTVHCSNDRYPNDGRICQTLGQMLARIGLEMKVEAQPKSVFFPKIFPPKGEYAFAFLGWGAIDGTPSTGLTGIIHSYDPGKKFGSYNVMGFSNPALDARIEALSAEFDPTRRSAMERALLADVAKEWPVIPLYAGSVVLASKKGIAYDPRPDELTLANEAHLAK
jgi:peptide/nickel transport system substrate-binding protein